MVSDQMPGVAVVRLQVPRGALEPSMGHDSTEKAPVGVGGPRGRGCQAARLRALAPAASNDDTETAAKSRFASAFGALC